MELYIDEKLVFCETENDLKPNMIFNSIDTFAPSAIKTDRSKTVLLPDTTEANEVFSVKKDKYEYEMLDNGRLLLRGYCILDKIIYKDNKKTYSVILYSNLADFFYNLKGDDDNPKKLSDLYWKWKISESVPPKAYEDTMTLFTLDRNFVYTNWRYRYTTGDWYNQKRIPRTFMSVPCECSNSIDTKKTIINNEDELFPLTGPNNSTCWTYNDTPYLLVESVENTSFSKHCYFPSQMPIGISYRDLILTCCDPDNNGGYTVELDPDFFNEDNDYWTCPYILRDTIFKYDVEKSTDTFGSDTDNGNWSVARQLHINATRTQTREDTAVINASGSSTIWTASNNKISTNYSIFGNKLEITLNPLLTFSLPQRYQHFTYDVYFYGNLHFYVTCYDGDGNEIANTDIPIQFKKLYFNHLSTTVAGGNATFVYGNKTPITSTLIIPDNETTLSFSLKVKMFGTPINGVYCDVYSEPYLPINDYRLDFKVPLTQQEVQTYGERYASGFVLKTDYFNNNAAFTPQTFTKKDIFENMLTPFDYLVNYTKMFNLRYVIDPASNKIQILTFNNYYKNKVKNIDDVIDYSNIEVSTSIIDEGNIKFNLEPDENDTVNEYMNDVDSNLFDNVVKLNNKNNSINEYISSSSMKIGSRNRFTTPFMALYRSDIEIPLYDYCGFNQPTEYKLNYLASDYATTKNIQTDTHLLKYYKGVNQYDFLQINDINNTIVMYGGMKEATTYENEGVTLFPPIIIADPAKQVWDYAETIPYFGGFEKTLTEGQNTTFFYSNVKITKRLPIFGLASNFQSLNFGLTYHSIDYKSIVSKRNIYDEYFKDMVDKIYKNQEQVKCMVLFRDIPDMRIKYFFNNSYWILTEVNEYNYTDDMVECTFVKLTE